jgi:O-antigen/teichoic acid export membrane protein
VEDHSLEKVLAKGTIYLMSAQLIFLIGGYAIHFGLGRYLGPELYGTFGVIISLLTICRVLVESGTVGAVSKYTAERRELVVGIKNQIIKIQIIFALIIFAFLFTLASLIAGLLKDSTLTSYIRFIAFFIPISSLYAVYLGLLNGIRAFGKQAKISIIYEAIKVLAVFTLVFLGFKVWGAITGYLMASVVSLIMAYHYWISKDRKDTGVRGNFEIRKIIKFAVPVILFSLAFNLVISLDLFFVKAILGEKAQAGFYTSAAALSKVPYFIFFALSGTLFPSIAKSTSDKGSEELTKRYINQSLRYALIFLVPCAFIISATSRNLVSLVYTGRYLAAASPLSILIFGLTFLCLFIILTTVITASGKPSISLAMVLVLLVVNIVLNKTLVSIYGLIGAAMATTITGFLGVLMSGIYVYDRFHSLTNLLSLFRIVAASSIIYIIARSFSVAGIPLFAYYAGLLAIYFALLFIFREIEEEDIQVARGIFSGLRKLRER